jgi:uncharacterized damage-inducible protein DinB
MSEYSDHFSRYVRYNVWANKGIADFLADKDSTLFDREIISSFSSIRKTIFHIADAQYIWLARLHGTSLSDWPSKHIQPEEALTALMDTSTAYAAYCADKDDAFWNEVVAFKTMDGTAYRENIGNITMHVVNHSTFHRGQLITLFRQAGVEGKYPKTDFIAYLRETGT